MKKKKREEIYYNYVLKTCYHVRICMARSKIMCHFQNGIQKYWMLVMLKQNGNSFFLFSFFKHCSYVFLQNVLY